MNISAGGKTVKNIVINYDDGDRDIVESCMLADLETNPKDNTQARIRIRTINVAPKMHQRYIMGLMQFVSEKIKPELLTVLENVMDKSEHKVKDE